MTFEMSILVGTVGKNQENCTSNRMVHHRASFQRVPSRREVTVALTGGEKECSLYQMRIL